VAGFIQLFSEFKTMLSKLPASGRRIPLALAAAAFAQAFAFGAAAGDTQLPKTTGFDLTVKDGQVKHAARADAHGPIGVMGDHRHHEGELMLSYRYMRMQMEGNLIGQDSVSPNTIVTTVPNRFFGMPMQPPTLRIVPTEMNMDMNMFGAMYGVTDTVTLMGMLPLVSKHMDLLTYAGPVGTRRLGTFSTSSEGIGDASLSALIGLYDQKTPQGAKHLNLMLGLSAPTGSITETGQVLTPMGMRPTVRLPYAMQLGSGTWDFLPGITYTDRRGNLSFGAQYRGWVRLEDKNDEGYRLGDRHQVTGWAEYEWAPWVANSIRLAYQTQDSIHGIDSQIVGPVQTANPDFYGGDRLDLLFGVNLIGQRGAICGHRLAAEFGVPVYQNLNGPQMETDWTLTVGWQKTIGDC
jgi:hypothetical protein